MTTSRWLAVHAAPSAAFASLLSAGLLAGLLAAPRAQAFEPLGELNFTVSGLSGGGATFDRERVVGPIVNMSIQEAGGWAGDLGHKDMELEVSPTRLFGAGVSLVLAQKDGALTVEGLFFGQRVRLDLNQKTFTGRYGTCSFDLKRARPGLYVGDVGCLKRDGFPATGKATFKLTGQAGQPDAPLPQLPLALLAVLPS
jgi:hypothetical protein